MFERIRTYLREYVFVLGAGRRRLPLILLITLLSAALDIIGVGMIGPLVVALIPDGDAPSFASNNPYAFYAIGAVVMVVFLLKGLVSFHLVRMITRFSETHRAYLMARLMRAYQSQPWEFHLNRNSASMINAVVTYTGTFSGGTLTSSLRLITDLIVFVSVGTLLAIQDPIAVATLVLIMSLVFFVVTRWVRRGLLLNARLSAERTGSTIDCVNQAIGGYKEIRVLGTDDYFQRKLTGTTRVLANAMAETNAYSQMPRYVVEVAMVWFLAVLAIVTYAQQGSIEALIATLGTFGVAAIRLMPATNSILTCFNALRGSRFILGQLAQDLRAVGVDPNAPEALPERSAPASARPTVAFESLALDQVSFSYRGAAEPALNRVSFTVNAGDVVGVVGKSGAGKSTLADVILGFLKPQTGVVRFNGRDIHDDLRLWLDRVAYIPQAIYLLDDTVRRNVVFGVDDADIDEARVMRAIEQSQLKEVVENLPHGLDTMVGERGVRLSGGQRQRVALARAFYHNRDFILMDEATSALDHDTELEVVRAIEKLHGSKTLVIIAHRTSTLAGCDRILRFADGKLAAVEAAAGLAHAP
jgi:ATP-binding cassette, subfamily B, bacterial PglK